METDKDKTAEAVEEVKKVETPVEQVIGATGETVTTPQKPTESREPPVMPTKYTEITLQDGDVSLRVERNLLNIKHALTKNKESLDVAGKTLSIKMEMEDGSKRDFLTGTYADIMELLEKGTFTKGVAGKLLHHLIVRLVESSGFRCGIFTFVIDDSDGTTTNQSSNIGGFGILNDLLPVTEAHALSLLSAAYGQLEMYTNKMLELNLVSREQLAKLGISFDKSGAADRGNIVIATKADMRKIVRR